MSLVENSRILQPAAIDCHRVIRRNFYLEFSQVAACPRLGKYTFYHWVVPLSAAEKLTNAAISQMGWNRYVGYTFFTLFKVPIFWEAHNFYAKTSTVDLSYVLTVKSMVEILQNFVAFSYIMYELYESKCRYWRLPHFSHFSSTLTLWQCGNIFGPLWFFICNYWFLDS